MNFQIVGEYLLLCLHPPHSVDSNPEPGESVLHLIAPLYLRFASRKPAENLTAGFNEYCLWLRSLQITFPVAYYSALPPVRNALVLQ